MARTKLSYKKNRAIQYRQFCTDWKDSCCVIDLETGEKRVDYHGNRRCRMIVKARVINLRPLIKALFDDEE